MKPYRDLFPHAGKMLPNTANVAERVVVLPNGTSIDDDVIDTVVGVVAVATNR
jgi:dTDP-4-amino-4,6-dideoxygalactose transaminase